LLQKKSFNLVNSERLELVTNKPNSGLIFFWKTIENHFQMLPRRDRITNRSMRVYKCLDLKKILKNWVILERKASKLISDLTSFGASERVKI